MAESQLSPGTKGLWARFKQWLMVMDVALDASETELLERRVRALEFAVAELERAAKLNGYWKTPST